jgi:hypothetical protein
MSDKTSEKSWAQRNIMWLVLGGVFLVMLPILLCTGVFALFYVVKTNLPPGSGQFGQPAPITQAFYYDIQTGKLFPGPVEEFPPIATPDKSILPGGTPAGVRANVFSCLRCNEHEWYIGYLETYLPKAKEVQIRMNKEIEKMANQPAPSGSGTAGAPVIMGPSPQEMMMISEGHLVADPADVNKWYKQESPEGAALINAAMKKCPNNKYPTQCFPGR